MIQFLERIPGYVYDLAVYGGIVALVLVMAYLSPSVHAAPLAKQQPGCVQFATIGTIEIYHCIDPSGNEFEANSLGFMAVVQ
jgi:hypothetical protein